jgi:hypothetical protein
VLSLGHEGPLNPLIVSLSAVTLDTFPAIVILIATEPRGVGILCTPQGISSAYGVSISIGNVRNTRERRVSLTSYGI